MVGEIRDGETAKMAIEAALTGHFVLSTLHTNDAPAAITRPGDGRGAVPDRRGRDGRARATPRASAVLELRGDVPTVRRRPDRRVSPDVAAASDGTVFYRKRGCARCGQSGYKGRIGIYQLMVMTEEPRPWPRRRRRARSSSERPSRWGCGRSGTTAWRRSPRASPRWKSARPRDGLIAAECHEEVTTSARTRAEPDMSGVRPRTSGPGTRV